MIKLIIQYWRQITLLTLALITVLSLTPLSQLPEAPGSDKAHHLVAYFLLALPVALKAPRHWLLMLAGFVLWSGGIELLQPYVNRHSEWLDLLANTIGIVLAPLFVCGARRFQIL